MFLFLFLSSLWSAFASVKSCGGLFTITTLALSPDVVRPGDNVSLTLKYVNPTVVTGGTVKNSATYNFIPLSPTSTDLCQTIHCPQQPGEYDGSSSFIIPTGVSGSLVLKTQWIADTTLLCITSSIQVQ
jgi:hypothetical protein